MAGSPASPEAYMEGLDEPRRSEVRRLHELIRGTAPDLSEIEALLRRAASSPAPGEAAEA